MTRRKRTTLGSVLDNRMTAAAGVAYAREVQASARSRVLAVADRFHGTLPPPPWPEHEALTRARARLATVERGLQAIADRAPDAPLSMKARTTIERGVADVRRELAVLEGRAETAKTYRDLALPTLGGFAVAALVLLVFASGDNSW